MAAITLTDTTTTNGPVTLTPTTLGSSDTLSYVPKAKVMFQNTTGSSVDVTITGSTATSISPPGYGGTVSVAGGKVVTVPANGYKFLELDKIVAYLSGTITVTGGTGCKALYYK